jgi:hypothetical protein
MLYNQYRKKSIGIVCFLLFFYFPLWIFSNDLEKVETLKAFLENPSNFFLHKLDDFDGSIPWKFWRSTSYIQNLSFSPILPDSEAFSLETKSFPETFSTTDISSLMIHTHLEIPEREKIILTPQVKIILPQGIPVRSFIWIKSFNYKCELLANFKYSSKEWTIPLGNLDFVGWRRLEKPLRFFQEYPKLQTQKTFELKSIQVHCGKSQPKGMITLYIDRLSALMENSSPNYPGSEIQDGWWLK